MKVSLSAPQSFEKYKSDMLALGIFWDKSHALTLPKTLGALQAPLTEAANFEGFLGKPGQTFILRTLQKSGPKYVVLLGLGEKSGLGLDAFRKAGGQAFKIANDKHAKSLAISLPFESHTTPDLAIRACAEGAHMASYRFDAYVSENKPEVYVSDISILSSDHGGAAGKQLLNDAKAIAESVCLARDLINEGPAVINPPELAKRAQKLGKALGLNVDVLDEKALAKENMNLMLAVGRASLDAAPPRLVRIAYRPSKKAKKHIAIVGKGVTFDSGGLDIKTAEGMLDMKIDMSGAAAVFGTLIAVAKLKPDVAVTGYLACVENGISAHAYHPGDVVKSRRGLYIEINNTDAEGRLILADAMDYAQSKDKPDVLIDVATLTGACMIALGLTTAAVFSDSDELSETIIKRGKDAGESFWRLPLNEDIRDQLKSPLADMKNSGGRYGGAITAALFLKKFVNEDVEWAHLDIAGPASNDKDHPYLTKGAAGFAVRTLVEFIGQS
jgi:leucyl aminopeptidase